MYELSIFTFLTIGKILSIETNTTKGENSMIGSFSFDFSSVYAQLTSFAKLENFWSLFDTAFGSSYDFATAANFRSQWQSQDFSLFPQIEVVSSDVLGSAKGAYAISTNRIYLSDQFVSVASQQSLEAVILEEFGHFIDAQVNATDTPGDEGELFSDLVRGVELSSSELTRIQTEDDHAVISLGGQFIDIEKADLIPYKPDGWDAPLVISTISGTNTDAAKITTNDTLYIDWATTNSESDSVSGSKTRLLLDNESIGSWPTSYSSLDLSYFISYSYLKDIKISPLSSGNHTLSLEIDSGNNISESNESNNVYNKVFNVVYVPPIITLSVYAVFRDVFRVQENGFPLTFTFTRTGSLTDSLTVNYTIGGTATNGVDYTTIPSSVTFPANSNTATVTLTPKTDTIVERDETVAISLTSGTGYTIGTTTAATGTIGEGTGNITKDGGKLKTSLIRFQNTDKPGTYLFAGEQEAASIRQNNKNFNEEGFAFQVAVSKTDPLMQGFYRFRNTDKSREGTYLFAGEQESASIRQNNKNFIEEGLAFYAYPSGIGGETTIDFTRFQNNSLSGTYLFTGPVETSSLMNNSGFTLEGSAFAAAG